MTSPSDDYLRRFFQNYTHSSLHSEEKELSHDEHSESTSISGAYQNLKSFQSRKEINLKAMFESIKTEEQQYQKTLSEDIPKITEEFFQATESNTEKVTTLQKKQQKYISEILANIQQVDSTQTNSKQRDIQDEKELQTILHTPPQQFKKQQTLLKIPKLKTSIHTTSIRSTPPFLTPRKPKHTPETSDIYTTVSPIPPFQIQNKEANHSDLPQKQEVFSETIRESRGTQPYLDDIWEYAPERIPFFGPDEGEKAEEEIMSNKQKSVPSSHFDTIKRTWKTYTQHYTDISSHISEKSTAFLSTQKEKIVSFTNKWRENREKNKIIKRERAKENLLQQEQQILKQQEEEREAAEILQLNQEKRQKEEMEARVYAAEKEAINKAKRAEKIRLHKARWESFSKKTGQLLRTSKKIIPTLPTIKNQNIRDSLQVAGMVASVFIVGFVGLRLPGFMAQYENIWNADLFAANQSSIEQLVSEPENPFANVQSLPVAGEIHTETEIPLNTFFNITPPDTRIVIPKIAKNIPILQVDDSSRKMQDWEQLEADIQDALKDGVVHYPGTALPGDDGNVFVTGHSSYYPWDPGRYKDVFAALHNLEVGDEYFIFHNGKKYRYVIRERKVVPPSDVSVLDQNHNKKEATLMTCTPIGTAKNRLILKADQVAVEY